MRIRKTISIIMVSALVTTLLSGFSLIHTKNDIQASENESTENIRNIGNNYTYNWYSSLDTAILDANNLSTANSDCSENDEDCKAGLYIADNIAYLVLTDECISNGITFNQDTVFDLNGNSLAINSNGSIIFNEDLSLMNGTVSFAGNSLINTVNQGDFVLDNIIIDNDYSFNSTTSSECEMSLIDVNSVNIDISDVNYTSWVTNLYDSTSYNPKVTLFNFKNLNSTANIDGLTVHDYTCYREKGVFCDSDGGNKIVCNGNLDITDSSLNFASRVKYGIYCTANSNALISCDNVEINSSNSIPMDYGIYITHCNKYTIKNSEIRGMSKGGIYTDTGNKAAIPQSSVENNTINIFKKGTMFGMRLKSCIKIINNTVTCTITEKTSPSAVNMVIAVSNNVTNSNYMTEIYGNDLRCFSNIKETKNDGLELTAYSGMGHIKSGYFYVDPVTEITNYANNDPTRCNVLGTAIRIGAGAGYHSVIDESKGDTVAIGGDFGLQVFGNCTINEGTFKAPCHGGAMIQPNNGAYTISINGGTFENNKYSYSLTDYPQIAKCGDFGALYLGYDKGSGEVVDWTMDINNATIGNGKSGTYGLVFYGNAQYVPPTAHLYNCSITGLANDIRIDATNTSANAYCYIENGTMLHHDGTNQACYDPFISSGNAHIIDNRTEEQESGSYYNWYTSLENAIDDANELSTENADCNRNDEDCEAGIMIVDDVAYLILVKDATIDTVTINVDTVFDLDGNELTLSQGSQIYFNQNLTVSNGTIESNTQTVLNATISSSDYSSGELNINGLIINNNYLDTGTETYVKAISCDNISSFNMNNSEINNITSGENNTYSFRGSYGIYINNNNSSVNINNSSIVCNNAAKNSYKPPCTALYFYAESANICNSNIFIENMTSNENSGMYYRGGRNNPMININNNHIVVKSYFKTNHWMTCMGIRVTTHNIINIHNNYIETLSHRKTYGMMLYNKSGSQNYCDMYGNEIRAMLSGAYDNCEAVGVVNNGTNIHIKGDYIYSDPSLNTSSAYNGQYSSTGDGLRLLNGSTTVIDESEGETIIIGGEVAINANNGSNVTINSGTFKSPNYGCMLHCGAEGHCEINGGVFRNNPEEYSQEKLKGIHDYSALYIMSETDSLYEVNVSNATIIGGTQGLNIKGADGWYGATCYVYNCFIKGRSTDILLTASSSSTVNNSYCYIEDGTVLFHDGTESVWYDAPARYGWGTHIIDNRQPETTTEEPTTPEPETTTPEPTTEAVDPNFVISKKQLALTNGLRFYLKADKTLFTSGGYTDPTMVIEFNNGETVVEEYVEEAQYYAFPFSGIAPHQMGYTFSATLHAYKNGVEYVSPALEYSVEQYCYDVFDVYKQYSYNQYAKLFTLLVDLLNYGAQAQLYTNTDTDNLVNSNLTEQQQGWATESIGDLTDVKTYEYQTIDNPGVTWKGSGLNLRDAIAVRLRVETTSIDGLVVKVRDDNNYEWVIPAEDFECISENQYYIYFEGFNVGRMSDNMYFTVYNGDIPVSNTCRYSVESYVYACYQDNNSLASLVTAMMKYGKSAKAFSS